MVKSDLKYKHSGATGKLVGVVSIEDITVYHGSNSTAMSATRISTTILASMWACTPASPTLAPLGRSQWSSAPAGPRGWSSWPGTCSRGSGAVRASSQSRAALLQTHVVLSALVCPFPIRKLWHNIISTMVHVYKYNIISKTTYVGTYTCTYKYNIISKTTWNTCTQVPNGTYVQW